MSQYTVDDSHRVLDDFVTKVRGDVLNKEKLLYLFTTLKKIEQEIFVIFNAKTSFKDAEAFKPKDTPVLPHVVVADKINGEQLEGFEVFLVPKSRNISGVGWWSGSL